MDVQWYAVLARTPLFQGMERSGLKTMLDCLQPKVAAFKKTAVLALAGEPFTGIGIVLAGSVAVTKDNAAGSRVLISLLGPGEMFGEIAAFSGGGVWPATIHAQEDCTVLFLPPDKLLGQCEKMCSSHRSLIANMLRVVSNKALLLNRKVEYLTMRSLRTKISSFLLEQYRRHGRPLFRLPMNRSELADFFHTARPSLSREMCQMRDEGLIDFHQSTVKLTDIEGLQQIAAQG